MNQPHDQVLRAWYLYEQARRLYIGSRHYHRQDPPQVEPDGSRLVRVSTNSQNTGWDPVATRSEVLAEVTAAVKRAEVGDLLLKRLDGLLAAHEKYGAKI